VGYKERVKRALSVCIVVTLLIGAAPAAAGGERLRYREVIDQGRGPGTDRVKWRAYATDRSELRSAWERFNMRGELPRIGFERRVAVFAGTGGSSSCPPDLGGLRLKREEKRILVRILIGTSGAGGCTADWMPRTFVVSVLRSDLPRDDLTVRVRRVDR